MKKVLFIGLLCALSCSCKNRNEQIGLIPTSPQVKIFKSGILYSFLRDSVKLSNPNYRYYGIDLRLSDSDRYYSALTFSYNQGIGRLLYRADTLSGPYLPFKNYGCLVSFAPLGEGLSHFEFTAADQLHNTNKAVLELLTFRNLLPVSLLTVTPSKVLDPLEYILDASKSYDADHNLGGGITQYIYVVEGQTISTSKSQIKHIFSAPGIYSITLTTRDNDGDYSPTTIVSVAVN